VINHFDKKLAKGVIFGKGCQLLLSSSVGINYEIQHTTLTDVNIYVNIVCIMTSSIPLPVVCKSAPETSWSALYTSTVR
jgi:hypothetical protein